MKKLKKILGLSLIAFSLLVGTSKVLAVQIPLNPEIFETSLAAPMLTTDSSLTLANGTYRDGITPIVGYVCLTIDVNSPQAEFMCGTASSTNVSISLRGITGNLGTATSSLFIFTHRRGADVRITTYPIVSLLAAILNGQLTIPNVISYASSVASSTVGLNGSNVASVDYVNSVALSGAPNASETIKGVVELATNLEAASSTSIGGTGARLVIPASISTSTCQVAQFGSNIVSSSTGKLGIGCFDGGLNYVFTASTTFTATSTHTAQTVLATTSVNGINDAPKFGGDGSFGTINISSGTTTVSCTTSIVCVVNYRSLSITGTGVLLFTTTAPTGVTVVIRVQGDTLITATSTAINVIGLGGAGGVANTVGTSAVGFQPYPGSVIPAGSAGGAASGSATGGIGMVGLFSSGDPATTHNLLPGSGGGGANGIGGRGGGALYVETAGNLTIGSASSIDASGQNGTSGGVSGGGGGGGGGSILFTYGGSLSNSGTFVATGGTGGSGNSGGVAGGAGGTAISFGTGSGNGAASGSVVSGGGVGAGGGAGRGGNGGTTGGSGGSTPSAGGGGGGGSFTVVKNIFFN